MIGTSGLEQKIFSPNKIVGNVSSFDVCYDFGAPFPKFYATVPLSNCIEDGKESCMSYFSLTNNCSVRLLLLCLLFTIRQVLPSSTETVYQVMPCDGGSG
ncbi:hypothetical protein TNCV_3024351, partial [Trichonephila clavipes]